MFLSLSLTLPLSLSLSLTNPHLSLKSTYISWVRIKNKTMSLLTYPHSSQS